jgi:2'-5'-oligoadenylate synthetase 1, domain 2, C-terminus/Nucleotidyltransferase domain
MKHQKQSSKLKVRRLRPKKTDTLLGRREGTKVTKVIKAGSLGKNTSLPHSDADIVVFVRNIRGAALDLTHSKSELLEWLANILQEQLPQLEILSIRTHVVGMRLPVGTAEIDDADELERYVEVDLLVARDFCLGEPNPGLQACQTLQHIEYLLEEEAMQLQQIEYDNLQGEFKAAAIASVQQQYASKRADLSVCPTETQKIFVKQQPEKINKLIRLVKKRVLQNAAPITIVTDTGTITVNMKEHAKQQGINSYLIELLVIWAVRAEDAARPGAPLSLTQYFERLYSIVRNPITLKSCFPPVTWPDVAKRQLPEVVGASSPFHRYYTKNALKERPTKLVVDPGNSTNNTARRINASEYGWQMLKKACDPNVALKVSFLQTVIRSVAQCFKFQRIRARA